MLKGSLIKARRLLMWFHAVVALHAVVAHQLGRYGAQCAGERALGRGSVAVTAAAQLGSQAVSTPSLFNKHY